MHGIPFMFTFDDFSWDDFFHMVKSELVLHKLNRYNITKWKGNGSAT
jgi:hypothetical protein